MVTQLQRLGSGAGCAIAPRGGRTSLTRIAAAAPASCADCWAAVREEASQPAWGVPIMQVRVGDWVCLFAAPARLRCVRVAHVGAVVKSDPQRPR
jgi:hypothetical protein